MKKKTKNLIKNTLAGLVLTLSATLTGGCREPISGQNLGLVKVKPCKVEYSFAMHGDLFEKFSKQTFDEYKTIPFGNNTGTVHLTDLITGWYIGQSVGNLEYIINEEKTNTPILVCHDTTNGGVHIQRTGTSPTSYQSISDFVYFPAQKLISAKLLKIIQDDKVLISAELTSNKESVIFAIDVNDNIQKFGIIGRSPTPKELISPIMAGASVEFKDANSSGFVVYQASQVQESLTGVPSFSQEGLYSFHLSDGRREYISIDGKTDSFLQLLEDKVLIQRNTGEIWSVSLNDYSKKQVTDKQMVFLGTTRGTFLQRAGQFNGTTDDYIMYKQASSGNLNDNKLYVKNILSDKLPISIDMGLPIEKLLKAEEGLFVATLKKTNNKYSAKLCEFGFSPAYEDIRALDWMVSLECTDPSLYLIGAYSGVSFYSYGDDSPRAVFTMRKGSGYQVLSYPSILSKESTIMPFYTLRDQSPFISVRSSIIPQVSGGNTARLDNFLTTIFKRGELAVVRPFFSENSALTQQKDTGAYWYVNFSTGDIFGVSGKHTYKTHQYYRNTATNSVGSITTTEDFELKGVIPTSPPRFLLLQTSDPLHIESIIVKPE